MNTQAPAAALPFSIASRYSTRESFSLPVVNLAAATPTIAAGTPVQIPAVGYLKKLRLKVSLTATGGTAPALTADAPFNVITSLALKNSAGQNLIAPLTGYELYIYNKYSGMGQGYASAYGALGDPKAGRGYSDAVASPSFFIDVPIELDPSTGLGSIPALASNRAYQLDISFAAISTVWTGAPTSATVTVTATAHYWDVPVASTPGGVAQSTEPFGLGTLSLLQKESPIVAPGDQLTRLNNTGNVIRNLIFIARNSSGARVDADLPTISELYVDNNPMLRLTKSEWQDAMVRWFGLDAPALDAAKGLDTGVMVIPFHLLAGGVSGDPSNSHAQFLATLDATLLQFKGYDWGANISTATVLTQAIASENPQFIYSK